MRRDQLPPHKTSTFVLRRYKAVYVSVNKAACTSLKWLVADLQGESRQRFYRSLSREVSRTMTIHRRSLWRHTPMAAKLPAQELAEIAPENGWFIFAVVRHPTARLFSAWQSKLLLREPWWEEHFGHEPWFPRVPRSSEELLEDWLTFAHAATDDPEQRIMRNRHFAPQHWMLAPDKMPYTRVYGTREIPELLSEFSAHLRANGWEGEKLELPRSNETPLKPIRAAFPDDVLASMERIYAADFASFGYDGPLPDGLDPADRYPDAALQEIGRLVERSERINDMALRAREFRRDAEAARANAAAAENGNGHAGVLDRARRIVRPAPPAPPAKVHYLDFLRRLHGLVEPEAYLEIGVRHGDSLALAECPAIGVDPEFALQKRLPASTTVFQEASDEFFLRSKPLEAVGGRSIDLAFIDGMHLAEFALRDFINVEQLSRWTGAIVFDDVLPDRPVIAARDRRTRVWTGDVYKLPGILARHRPDLICVRVGTQPTGLLLVLGLDPQSRTLRKRYDEIVAGIVTPDPQDVPADVLERTGVADPERVLEAPFWDDLRAARAQRAEREAGLEPLRAAVKRDLGSADAGRLRRLLPV
jgi:predicted O-methyltransferase YrrM